jgi:hypothetical protein
VCSSDSFDAERRLARMYKNIIDGQPYGSDSFDAERRLAQVESEETLNRFFVQIPSMPKGV